MRLILDFTDTREDGGFFVVSRGMMAGAAVAAAALALILVFVFARLVAAYWINTNSPIAADIAQKEIRAQSADRRRLWNESIGILRDDIAAINARVLALHRKGAILSDYIGLPGEEMFALPQADLHAEAAPATLLCEADETDAEQQTLEERQIQITDVLHQQTSRLNELERKFSILRDQGIDITVLKKTLPKERPIMGRHWVSSRYGYRRDPFTGRRAFHGGDDYAARKGTPIVAAAAGIVLYAGRLGNYGNAVHLYHGDDISTLYGHMERIDVKIWQYVSQDDIIGTVGSTGRSTGPHLHYEVRIKNRPQSILGAIKKLHQQRNLTT